MKLALSGKAIEFRDKEYTRCVKAIKSLQAKGDSAAWEIGRNLIEILDNKLYAHRHASFHQFCQSELEYTYTTAASYIAVARAFTKQQVMELGYCKLMPLAKTWIPEAQREAIAAQAGSMSVREVRRIAQSFSDMERTRRAKLAIKMRGRKPAVLSKLRKLFNKTYIRNFETGYCLITLEEDLGIQIRMFNESIHVSVIDPREVKDG